MTIANLWKKLWTLIANEPLVVAGVVFAAVNATHNQTILGYVAAGVIALLRFLVTGPLTSLNPSTPSSPTQPPQA